MTLTRSDIVPVFPLSNVALFPHTVLPLHVFEPRYREMVEDALRGEKRIAVAVLDPAGRRAEGPPPFHVVAGVGRVVRYTRLADGRYNITLSGEDRVMLEEVASERAYRKARLRVFPEEPGWLTSRSASRALREILTLGSGLGLLGDGVVPARLPRDPALRASLVNQAAAVVLAEPDERQALLEAGDYAIRAELVLRQLHLTERLMESLSLRGRPEDPSVN